HFAISPPKISLSPAPILTGPRISATLSLTSLALLPGFHLTAPPALASLTSPSPTQLRLPSFSTRKPLSPPPGPTMFPSRYFFRRHYLDHQHPLPTGTRLTGTPSRRHSPPLRSPHPPLCPQTTRS